MTFVRVISSKRDTLGQYVTEYFYFSICPLSKYLKDPIVQQEIKEKRNWTTPDQFLIRSSFNFQRLLYATAGTTGMGLVCFPEDTREILKNNSELAKQYINIAYNFLYGGNYHFYTNTKLNK